MLRQCYNKSNKTKEMDNVIEDLKPWEAVKFEWGGGVRHRKGKWQTIFLKDGQEIDVSEMNVILHDNGIEFYKEMN